MRFNGWNQMRLVMAPSSSSLGMEANSRSYPVQNAPWRRRNDQQHIPPLIKGIPVKSVNTTNILTGRNRSVSG